MDAPLPMKAMLTSSIFLPTTFRALISAARVTVAVPCWSSCQTGISAFSRSVSRMRKHLGCEMILQVDAAKPRLQHQHGVDDRVRVFGVQHDRHAVHPAQVFVQQRLAFHHRQAGFRADIAQPQHARAVADHRHRVPLVGVLVDQLRVGFDSLAGGCHPGCVPDGKVVEIAHGALQRGLHLPPVEWMQQHCIG